MPELATPDEVLDWLDDPEFQQQPFETRQQVIERGLEESSQFLQQQPDWNRETWQDFGRLTDHARQRVAESETFGEKAGHYAKVAGNVLLDTAKTLGTAALDLAPINPDITPKVPLSNVANAAVLNVAKLGDSVAASLPTEGNIATTGKLETLLGSLKQDIDSGAFFDADSPQNWLAERDRDLSTARASYFRAVQGAGDPATLQPLAEQTGLRDPEHQKLIGAYMQTRSPQAWEQLRASLLKSPTRRGLEQREKQEITGGKLGSAMEDVFGEGSSKYISEAGDPFEILGNFIPIFKGAKALKKGLTVAQRAGELAQGVGAEVLSEQGSLFMDNPNATGAQRLQTFKDTLAGSLALEAGGATVQGVANRFTPTTALPQTQPQTQAPSQQGIKAPSQPQEVLGASVPSASVPTQNRSLLSQLADLDTQEAPSQPQEVLGASVPSASVPSPPPSASVTPGPGAPVVPSPGQPTDAGSTPATGSLSMEASRQQGIKAPSQPQEVLGASVPPALVPGVYTGPEAHQRITDTYRALAEDPDADSTERTLARALAEHDHSGVTLEIVDDENATIQIGEDNDPTTQRLPYTGYHSPSAQPGRSKIGVNLARTGRGAATPRQTVLHEGLHHVLHREINEPRTPAAQEAVQGLTALRDQLASDPSAAAEFDYEISDLHEFVSGIGSSKPFKARLKAMPAPREAQRRGIRTMWDQFLAWVKQLVTGKPATKKTALDAALAHILTLTETSRHQGVKASSLTQSSTLPDAARNTRFSLPQDEPTDYRGTHRAPTGEHGEGSLDAMDRTYPDDLYSSNGARYYGDATDTKRDAEMHRLLLKLRGKPAAKVTVYRAVPKGEGVAILPGDWVTPNRAYAAEHGARFDEGFDILEAEVLAGDIYTEGNSIFEYGWSPKSTRLLPPQASSLTPSSPPRNLPQDATGPHPAASTAAAPDHRGSLPPHLPVRSHATGRTLERVAKAHGATVQWHKDTTRPPASISVSADGSVTLALHESVTAALAATRAPDRLSYLARIRVHLAVAGAWPPPAKGQTRAAAKLASVNEIFDHLIEGLRREEGFSNEAALGIYSTLFTLTRKPYESLAEAQADLARISASPSHRAAYVEHLLRLLSEQWTTKRISEQSDGTFTGQPEWEQIVTHQIPRLLTQASAGGFGEQLQKMLVIVTGEISDSEPAVIQGERELDNLPESEPAPEPAPTPPPQPPAPTPPHPPAQINWEEEWARDFLANEKARLKETLDAIRATKAKRVGLYRFVPDLAPIANTPLYTYQRELYLARVEHSAKVARASRILGRQVPANHAAVLKKDAWRQGGRTITAWGQPWMSVMDFEQAAGEAVAAPFVAATKAWESLSETERYRRFMLAVMEVADRSRDAAVFTKNLVSRFGKWIREHAPKLWAAAKDSTGKAVMRLLEKIGAVKFAVPYQETSQHARAHGIQFTGEPTAPPFPEAQLTGTCVSEQQIEAAFGSLDNFEQLVAEKGDEFEHNGVTVTYNPRTHEHFFWTAQNATQPTTRLLPPASPAFDNIKPGDPLSKAKKRIPRDSMPMPAGVAHIRGMSAAAAAVEDWMRTNVTATDPEGRRVLINNPEPERGKDARKILTAAIEAQRTGRASPAQLQLIKDSLNRRARHLIGDEKGGTQERAIDSEKAATVFAIQPTIANPHLIATERGKGGLSRIYLRRYATGHTHYVFTDPTGAVSDQGIAYDVGLLTQYTPEPSERFEGATVAWRRTAAPADESAGNVVSAMSSGEAEGGPADDQRMRPESQTASEASNPGAANLNSRGMTGQTQFLPPGESPLGFTEEGKPRSFGQRIASDPRLSDDTRAVFPNLYNPIPNEQTLAEADAFISEAGGPEAAARQVMDASVPMPEHVRVAVGMQAMLRLDAEAQRLRRRGDAEAAANLQDLAYQLGVHVDELGTASGRAIQAFSMWSRMTPEGALTSFEQRVKEKNNGATPTFPPDLLLKIKDIVDRINGRNTPGAAEQQLAELETLLGDSLGAAGATTREVLADEKAKAREAATPDKKAVSLINRLAQQLSDTPPAQQVKRRNEIADLAKQHLREPMDDFIPRLTALGVSATNAETLDNLLAEDRRRADTIAREKAAQALVNRLQPRTAPEKKAKVPRLVATLIAAVETGALHRPDFQKAFTEAFDMPALPPEAWTDAANTIRQIGAAPPGSYIRQDLMRQLMAELARYEGLKVTDLLTAFWYANILSGAGTHAINIAATGSHLLARGLSLLASDPQGFKHFIKGLFSGAKQGLRVARGVMRGEQAIKSETKYTNPAPLELLYENNEVRFRDQVLQHFGDIALRGSAKARAKAFLSFGRYVFRALSAADAFFYHTAKEARAHVAAARWARSQPLTPHLSPSESFRAYLAEALASTPSLYQDALAQAAAELKAAGLPVTVRDQNRRAYEIVEAQRPREITEEGARFGELATFTGKPEGMMGEMANGMNYVIQKFAIPTRFGDIRLLQPFVPFVNIVANVASAGLDFTPYGYLRATGSRAERGGHLGGKAGDPLTKSERNERLAAATLGTLATGLIAALAAAFKDDEDPPFMVTAMGPANKAQRQQLMLTGWRPFSITLFGKHIPFNETVLGVPLAVIGSIMDQYRYNQGKWSETALSDRVGYAVAMTGKSFFEAGFLKGIGNLIDVITGDTSPKNAIATPISGIIPAQGLLRDIARITDPEKIDDTTLRAAVFKDVPFVKRIGTKPALNVFGEPVKLEGLQRIPAVSRFINGETLDKEAHWLAKNKLWISGLDFTEVSATLPSPTHAEKRGLAAVRARRAAELGAQHAEVFTPEESYKYAQRAGELTRQSVKQLRTQYETGQIAKESLQKRLNRSIEGARERSKRQLLFGPKP